MSVVVRMLVFCIIIFLIPACDTGSQADTDETESESSYSVYHDLYVRFLRKRLNDYLSNRYDRSSMPADRDVYEGGTFGLDSFDKDYYRSRFIVAAIEDYPAGGKTIEIIFEDRPDKMFTAWIYVLADGNYDFWAFFDSGLSKDEVQEVLRSLMDQAAIKNI